VSTAEATIWDRLILPEKGDVPEQTARFLLTLDFTEQDRARMNELAAKAREGGLSVEETDEIDGYLHVGHTLALMKSKARRSLERTSPASSS